MSTTRESTTRQPEAQTVMVQVRLGARFEDVFVTARTEREAIRKARRVTTLPHRFARFVV